MGWYDRLIHELTTYDRKQMGKAWDSPCRLGLLFQAAERCKEAFDKRKGETALDVVEALAVGFDRFIAGTNAGRTNAGLFALAPVRKVVRSLTRHGVFPWNETGVYNGEAAVKLYAQEHHAQRLATRMTAARLHERGFVVRSVAVI